MFYFNYCIVFNIGVWWVTILYYLVFFSSHRSMLEEKDKRCSLNEAKTRLECMAVTREKRSRDSTSYENAPIAKRRKSSEDSGVESDMSTSNTPRPSVRPSSTPRHGFHLVSYILPLKYKPHSSKYRSFPQEEVWKKRRLWIYYFLVSLIRLINTVNWQYRLH